jgi:hypothetical protein
MPQLESTPALSQDEVETVSALFEDDTQGEILAFTCTNALACEDE